MTSTVRDHVRASQRSMDSRGRVAFSLAILSDHVLIGLAFLIAALSFSFGEKIPIGNGLGWDGQFYGTLASRWDEALAEKPLNKYTVVRILPSAAVNLFLRQTGLPLTDEWIIFAFGWLNVICVTISAWLWVRIANAMSLRERGKWLGFCTFFLSFAIAKHSGYYPVLTDIPAFTIGMGMLFCYLTGTELGLYVLTALGAFTWPTLLMQGTILLLFPRDHRDQVADFESDRLPGALNWRNLLLAGYATFCFTLAVFWALEHSHLPICGFIEPAPQVVHLSLLVAGTYLFFVFYRLIDVDRLLKAFVDLPMHHWRRLIGVVLFLVAIRYLYDSWAPFPGHSYGKLYILRLMIKAVYKPGVFLLGHAVYFGPILILGVLLWPQVSREIRRYGVGISLSALFALILGLDGESRHLMHAFPLLAPFVVAVVSRLNWGRRGDILFVVFSLLASKFWYQINSPDILSGSTSLLEFPLQAYALNYGVFMNNQTYLLQAAISLAVTWELYRSIVNHYKTAACNTEAHFDRSGTRAESPRRFLPFRVRFLS